VCVGFWFQLVAHSDIRLAVTQQGCPCSMQQPAMQWGTPTSADATFDVGAATGLYWRAVPVTMRLADREEHVADLTVRIMCSGGRNSHASRVCTLSPGIGLLGMDTRLWRYHLDLLKQVDCIGTWACACSWWWHANSLLCHGICRVKR
jgi:hypothetical protein